LKFEGFILFTSLSFEHYKPLWLEEKGWFKL